MSAPEDRRNEIVLITGASGFMGDHALRFARDNYRGVVASDIRPLRDPPAESDSFVFVQVDLTRPKDLPPLFKRVQEMQKVLGIDSVVIWHMGGLFNYGAPEKLIDSVNRIGTKNFADAAIAFLGSSIKRFVFWSGATVHGEFKFGLPATEESPCEPMNAYGWSKLRAEEYLRELDVLGRLPVTIMRITSAYGPGGPANEKYGMAILIRLYAEGRLPNIMVGDGGRKAPLIHAEDIIRSADFLAHVPEASGGIYLIVDEGDYTAEQISRFLGTELLNPFVPGVKLPESIFRFGGRRVLGTAKRFQTRAEVDGGLVDMILLNAECSGKKLHELARQYGRETGGPNPLLKYADSFKGLSQTITEYRKEGFIP